jgi:hypothetical protein
MQDSKFLFFLWLNLLSAAGAGIPWTSIWNDRNDADIVSCGAVALAVCDCAYKVPT